MWAACMICWVSSPNHLERGRSYLLEVKRWWKVDDFKESKLKKKFEELRLNLLICLNSKLYLKWQISVFLFWTENLREQYFDLINNADSIQTPVQVLVEEEQDTYHVSVLQEVEYECGKAFCRSFASWDKTSFKKIFCFWTTGFCKTVSVL